jgi:hypothetical protein
VASSWEVEIRTRRKTRRKIKIKTRKKTRIAKPTGTRLPSRSEKDAFQRVTMRNLSLTHLAGPLSSRTFSFTD